MKIKKTTHLHIRCTEENKKTWQESADYMKLPMSKWITQSLDKQARSTKVLERKKQKETANE